MVLSYIFCTDMAQRHPGKTCATLSITSENLANCNVREVPAKEITNGLIFELIRYQKLLKKPTKTLLKWLELLYGENWPQHPPAELTLTKSLNVLYQKHRKLVIQRNTEVLNEFCCSTYCLPNPLTRKVQVQPISIQGPVFKKDKRRSLFRQQQCQAYKHTARELAAELHSAQYSSDVLKSKVRILEEKMGHTTTRNIHKRERRKEAALASQKK